MFGGTCQHHGQLAGLFTQPRKHGQQARKAFFASQGAGQGRAFTYLHQRVHGVGAHGAIAQRFGRSLQGFEDRHTGPRQHGQRAAKTRCVVAPGQAAQQRQAQVSGVRTFTECFTSAQQAERHASTGQGQRHQPTPLAHKGTDGQHGDGQRGQGALGAGEHGGHLWHHVGDQKDHDAQRNQGHDGRVQHGAQQLGAQGLSLFQIVSEFFKHGAEGAALFTRRHHSTVDLVKFTWRRGQCTGKCAARVDFTFQVRNEFTLGRCFGFIGQGRQRTFQRQTRTHQTRHLACPYGQRRGAKSALTPARTGLFDIARGHGQHGQGHKLLGAQLAARRLGVVGFQDAFAGLACGVQGFKFVGGHGLRNCAG